MALAFLMPNLIGFLLFTCFPVLLSLWMAFTNWSLRPIQRTEFVGLRNFTDLLGVRTVEGAPAGVGLAGFVVPRSVVLTLYLLAVAVLLAAVVGLFWANVKLWRGSRSGGVIVALLGVVMAVLAVALPAASPDDQGPAMLVRFWFGPGQGVFFSGLVLLLAGLIGMNREDGTWRPGLGMAPAGLLAAAMATLWWLHDPMWTAYTPRDERFWHYFYNTLFLMLSIPVAIAGSLGLALLLNQQLPLGAWRSRRTAMVRVTGVTLCLLLAVLTFGIGLWQGWPNVGLLAALVWAIASLGIAFNIVTFRTIFYLPTFTAGVAVFILWKELYNTEHGPINALIVAAVDGLAYLAGQVGVDMGGLDGGPQWLAHTAWARPAMVIMGVWIAIGGTTMLLYLAALANMPKELLDAAAVDGAGPWQRFRHITWPQLAPTTFFVSVIAIIGGFQGGFEQARVMTEGGPAGSTTTLSYYIFQMLFTDLNLGYAAAVSWVLFVMIFIATAINWTFGKGVEVEA
ncbi:MAG: sugar ABC transporter permease [Phycisphaeraceae bacterium]